MKMPWSNFEGPAKFVVICLTIFLVAGGLCGLQSSFMGGMRGGDNTFGIVLAFAGFGELAVMLVSFALMVVGVLVWIIVAIRRGRSGGAGDA